MISLLFSIYCSVFHPLLWFLNIVGVFVCELVLLLLLFSHFSFDFHLRISLDVVSAVPLIMEPIDFYMKWVSI